MRPASPRKLGSRGIVASEVALMAPIFFLVALGTADLIRLFRAQMRAETIAVQIGQIVSQCRTITSGDVTNFWAHAQRIAGSVIDVNSSSGGRMMISAVSRNGNANRLSWQVRTGNNAAKFNSRLGSSVGGTATISDGFVVPASQTLMVTEVFATIQPFTLSAGLIGTVLNRDIYATTLFLSRAPDPTSLQTAPATNPVANCTA